MKSAPNSKTNLDKAIQRFAGSQDFVRANELRGLMANAIVAQMIGDGVVKGGCGLRFRYGMERIAANTDLNLHLVRDICVRLFKYRRGQSWPPTITAKDGWSIVYNAEKGDLPVLPAIEEAVAWTNQLVERIDAAR